MGTREEINRNKTATDSQICRHRDKHVQPGICVSQISSISMSRAAFHDVTGFKVWHCQNFARWLWHLLLLCQAVPRAFSPCLFIMLISHVSKSWGPILQEAPAPPNTHLWRPQSWATRTTKASKSSSCCLRAQAQRRSHGVKVRSNS